MTDGPWRLSNKITIYGWSTSYVDREVRWWLEHRPADHMLVVGTSPGLAWDEQLGNWAVTAPVPPALRGSRPGGEPRWVNMSDLGSGDGREPQIPPDKVAELAAPLRGMEKDELIGEHVKYRRRTLFTVMAALVALAALTVVALGFAGAASHQRVVAFSAALATQSEQLEAANPSLAAQLLLTAYHLDPQSQDLAWRLIGTESETLSAAENVGGTFDTLGGAVAFSPNSKTLATVGDGAPRRGRAGSASPSSSAAAATRWTRWRSARTAPPSPPPPPNLAPTA